jgi:uncharacterized protein (DUF58 family)
MLFLVGFLFGDVRYALLALSIPVTAAYARTLFNGELRNLRVEMNRKILDSLAFQGRPISVVLEIENLGSTQTLQIEDVLPAEVELANGSNKLNIVLKRGGKITQRYTIRPMKRGRLKMEEVRMTVFDRTGLFSSEISVPEESEIVVHVKEESLTRSIALAKRERLEVTHFAQQRWLQTRDFEFDGIRDYVPGDKFRDIHWKSLAKMEKLLTKFYRRDTMIPTVILVDCSRSMRLTKTDSAKIDHAVHLAIETAKILLAGHHPTGVVLFDEIGVIDILAPSVRKIQFDRIMMTLRGTPPHVQDKSGKQDEKILAGAENGVMLHNLKIDLASRDEESERFLSTVATFAQKKGIRQKKVGLEGLLSAGLMKSHEKTHLYILISDLESSRNSILRGAFTAIANKNKMVLATPFSYWYSVADKGGSTVEELESAYTKFESKLESERTLKRQGVVIVEIGPRDEAFKITREIRRRLT